MDGKKLVAQTLKRFYREFMQILAGAGETRILLKVILPMSLPIFATLAILIGLGYWHAYS